MATISVETDVIDWKHEADGWKYEAIRWRTMVLNAPTHVVFALFDPEYAKVLENLAKQDDLIHNEKIEERIHKTGSLFTCFVNEGK